MRDPWAIREKKDRRNLKILGSTILMIAIFVTSVFAIQWIYSNIVTVQVSEYTLNLAPTDQTVVMDHYAFFTATLTLDGSPVSDATVNLYFANDTATILYSNTTLSDGTCILKWNATGYAELKAGYLAP